VRERDKFTVIVILNGTVFIKVILTFGFDFVDVDRHILMP